MLRAFAILASGGVMAGVCKFPVLVGGPEGTPGAVEVQTPPGTHSVMGHSSSAEAE